MASLDSIVSLLVTGFIVSKRYKVNMPLSSEELWADCGKASQMTEKESTPDNLRGRFRIPSDVRETFDIDSESRIEVRVRHNGVDVKAVRPVHGDGVNFVLPAKEREELGLELGDTPEYWVRPAGESVSNETGDQTQVDLSDVVESEEDVEYVLLFNSTGRTLHATREYGETVCGKEIDSAQGYVNVDGPDNVGGEFSECQRCAQYATGFRSQPECRRFLAERIDAIKYDEGDSTPGYLNKNEMPALVAYIEELEEQVAEAG